MVLAETVLSDLDLTRPASAEVEVGEVDPAATLLVRVQVVAAVVGRPSASSSAT